MPIKDLNMVDGVRQTFGSAVYEDYVAAGDDYVVAAIRAAGRHHREDGDPGIRPSVLHRDRDRAAARHAVGSYPVRRRLQRRGRGGGGRSHRPGRAGQ